MESISKPPITTCCIYGSEAWAINSNKDLWGVSPGPADCACGACPFLNPGTEPEPEVAQ